MQKYLHLSFILAETISHMEMDTYSLLQSTYTATVHIFVKTIIFHLHNIYFN